MLAEPNQRDVGMLALTPGPDLARVDHACDDLVSEPDHHLGEQRERRLLVMRDEDAQLEALVFGHQRWTLKLGYENRPK